MSKKVWTWLVPLIVVIIILAIVILLSLKKPAEKEVIKIGAILPLTGKVASLGEDMKNAIILAQEKFRNKSGIEVEVIYQDEKADPKEAISAYQSLRFQNIKVIIGPGTSGSVLSVAPLAEQEKVIILTPSAAADAISDAGDFIFRNQVLMTQKDGKLGEFAAKKFSRVATIYDKSNEGSTLAEKAFVESVLVNGGNIVERQGLQKDATDFRTEIIKIKAANPDAIAIFALMPQAAIVLKQIKELGINAQILTEDAIATDNAFLNSVANFSEGIIFSGIKFDRDTNPEFWDSYKERFGKNPNIYAAQAYDSFMMLMDTIQKCNGIDTECIKNELYKIKNYPGAAGLTSFNEKGDAIKPIIIKTIKNGQFVPYEE